MKTIFLFFAAFLSAPLVAETFELDELLGGCAPKLEFIEGSAHVYRFDSELLRERFEVGSHYVALLARENYGLDAVATALVEIPSGNLRADQGLGLVGPERVLYRKVPRAAFAKGRHVAQRIGTFPYWLEWAAPHARFRGPATELRSGEVVKLGGQYSAVVGVERSDTVDPTLWLAHFPRRPRSGDEPTSLKPFTASQIASAHEFAVVGQAQLEQVIPIGPLETGRRIRFVAWVESYLSRPSGLYFHSFVPNRN